MFGTYLCEVRGLIRDSSNQNRIMDLTTDLPVKLQIRQCGFELHGGSIWWYQAAVSKPVYFSKWSRSTVSEAQVPPWPETSGFGLVMRDTVAGYTPFNTF